MSSSNWNNNHFTRRYDYGVPPVENQGGAGTCSIFAVLSGLSWLVSIKYGKYIRFSHQFVIDHISHPTDLGKIFEGVHVFDLLDFLKRGGVVMEKDYAQYCGVINRPSTVGLYAKSSSDKKLEYHSVLITGFGVYGGSPYYDVLNSHGPRYFADGYILVYRELFTQIYVINDINNVSSRDVVNAELNRATPELRLKQETRDPPGALNTLPTLSLQDIPKKLVHVQLR